jgi:phage gpG-like protein
MAVSRDFIQVLTKLYGSPEANKAIAQLRRRLDTIKPVLEDIGQLHVDQARYRIHTQTDPRGRMWKHNTILTQRYKRNGMKIGDEYRGPAVEGPNKRLVWQSFLRSSLKYRVSGNVVIVVADVPYARVQQEGAAKGKFGSFKMKGVDRPTPWGDIPARPFLGVNKKTNEKVLKILGDYLLGNQIAKGLGFSS